MTDELKRASPDESGLPSLRMEPTLVDPRFTRPGQRLQKNGWKDPLFLVGKSTISMAIFNSYVKLPVGIVG